MKITQNQLESLRSFMGDPQIDDEWLLMHIDLEFEDQCKTITIKIDNMNDQEYKWMKER